MWLSSQEPSHMLWFLDEKISPRKAALLACGMCRPGWHLLVDDRSRRAIEACEQAADGRVEPDVLRNFLQAAADAESEMHRHVALTRTRRPHRDRALEKRRAMSVAAWYQAARTVHCCLTGALDLLSYQRRGKTDRLRTVSQMAAGMAKRAARAEGIDGNRAAARERRAQCDLIRDLIGNPFRRAPKIDPGWLRWNGGTVSRMALAVYEQGQFADLPVLGDALEDAGCREPMILDHCRSAKVHGRGCWLLDALLGRAERTTPVASP
jgi:hypothetical protein